MFTGTETGGISAGESWQDHVQYQAGSCVAGLAGCSRPASLPAGQAGLCTQSLHQQASCSCLASLAGTPNTFLQPGTWQTMACAHEQSFQNSQGFSGYCKDPMNCCMAHICMRCRPDNIKDPVRQACVSNRDSSTHQPIKPYHTHHCSFVCRTSCCTGHAGQAGPSCELLGWQHAVHASHMLTGIYQSA